MSADEVRYLLGSSALGPIRMGAEIGPRTSHRNRWRPVEAWEMSDGAWITLFYDGDHKVTDKSFEEGDQSLTGRLKRLTGRLPLP